MTVFITEDGVVDVPFPPSVEALYCLLATERRLFSDAELYERLWGFVPLSSSAMATRVKLARRILEEHGIHGKIVTRRKFGYMLA